MPVPMDIVVYQPAEVHDWSVVPEAFLPLQFAKE
jgi:hypothetical protein